MNVLQIGPNSVKKHVKRLVRGMPKFLLVVALFLIVPTILYFTGGAMLTVLWFQLIVIWIQTEIALRQLYLFRAQVYPVITLEIEERSTMVAEDSAEKHVVVKVRNLSENPALNISIIEIVPRLNKRIDLLYLYKNVMRWNPINTLGPHESKEFLVIFRPDEFMEIVDRIEVSFIDRYGGWHSIAFFVYDFMGEVRFAATPPRIGVEEEKAGLLLPTLLEIASKLSAWHRRYRVL